MRLSSPLTASIASCPTRGEKTRVRRSALDPVGFTYSAGDLLTLPGPSRASAFVRFDFRFMV